MVLPRLSFFDLKQRSFARGLLLSLGAFFASLALAGFPRIEKLHGTHWQIAVVPFACWGLVETARCLRQRWSLYHAGVLILLYTELMVLAMVLVLCVFL